MAEKATTDESVLQAPVLEDRSHPFVHRWNELVSVTNWEKGRIICDWRTALVADGAPVTVYSDEAWAECVSNVTGQHVGRLRRTYERFGAVYAEYPGLFWSHFQVALDWDDAEMWLEGAVQNEWSVSQMRAKRWETLGAPESMKPRDEDVIIGEIDEDAGGESEDGAVITPRTATVRDVGESGGDESFVEGYDGEHSASGSSRSGGADHGADEDDDSGATASITAKATRSRPFENLPKLPDDVAEAFEQFKLAILTHKMTGWAEISRDDMLACLDALQALALQPADE